MKDGEDAKGNSYCENKMKELDLSEYSYFFDSKYSFYSKVTNEILMTSKYINSVKELTFEITFGENLSDSKLNSFDLTISNPNYVENNIPKVGYMRLASCFLDSQLPLADFCFPNGEKHKLSTEEFIDGFFKELDVALKTYLNDVITGKYYKKSPGHND